MRWTGWSWIACLVCLPAGMADAQTPQPASPPQPPSPSSAAPPNATASPVGSELTFHQHPWGRFCSGAWKLVRVTTESLSPQGQVTHASVTETKTTLLEVTASEVTLLVEVAVEVAGKKIQSEPQTVKQGVHGEVLVKGLQTKHVGQGNVTLDGIKIPCEIDQVEVVGATSRSVTRLFSSAEQMPFLLRRENVTTDLEGQQTLSRTDMEVLATDMPYVAADQIVSSAYVRTVYAHPGGTIITLAITSPDVPGGVISHSSKELDSQGVVVRRSTLELVDYNYRTEEDRGIFGRRRTPRTRKPLLHSAE